MNEVLKTIESRRSIRKFTDQPVDRETLILLLKAAMSAPTAMNAQPWEFVVVTEKDIIDRLRNGLMFGKMNPAVIICVLGSKRKQQTRIAEKFWIQDCSAASQNILLAATSLGLGGVWVGVHPVVVFERLVSGVLNLPEGLTPLNLIYLGYPAEEKEPRTQFDEDRVHWGPFPVKERRRPSGVFPKRLEITIEEDTKNDGSENI